MYKTPKGDRTLHDAERCLFTRSLGMIADYLSDGDYVAGITVFDALQRNQKIVVVLGVAKALLRDNTPPPPLTAISEAAVAAIYLHAWEQVVIEIQETAEEFPNETGVSDKEPQETRHSWRTLVLNAYRGTIDIDPLPPAGDSNEDEWLFLIDCLRDRVLWDTDWEMMESQDIDPERQRRIKEEMGIDDDYYVWVPLDPRDEVVAPMLTELWYLTPEGRNLHGAGRSDP